MVETQNFRFIPAGAGNTAPLKICTKAIAVYPRWRGEHYFCNAQRYSRIGLSPLARGTLAKQTSGYAWCRFIRWRGEHSIRRFCSSSDAGLSPLARGTHTKTKHRNGCTCGLSAGAGNTMKSHSLLSKSAVYPLARGTRLNDVASAMATWFIRWRGEHGRDVYQRHGNAGLSRWRGEHHQ